MKNRPGPMDAPNDPGFYGSPMYPHYGGAYDLHPRSGALLDNPLRLARVILKKWLTVLLCVAFAALAASFYLSKATKIYQAQSLVELSVRRPRILSQQAAIIDDPSATGSSEEIFNTRLQRFRGRAVMQAALDLLRPRFPQIFLDETHADLSEEETREIQIRRLMAGIELSLMRRTRIVQITFSHPDPQIAAAVCNAFAEAAEASVFLENRVSSDAAVAWLEAQELVQRETLQQADDALLAFMTESGLDARESQRKTVEEALLAFNRSLVELESQEARVKDLSSALEALTVDPEQSGTLPSGIPREHELREVLTLWRQAIVNREQLLNRYTANHPEVQATERLIDLYRMQASEVIDQARTTTQANQQLLARQAESLREKKQEQASLASELDARIAADRTRISALKRNRDAAEQAYRGILSRIQEARLAADEDTATVKIVEPATIPRSPVRPRPPLILALSLVVGMACGIGLALTTALMEDQISDPDDLLQWGLSVLALVPRVSTRNRSEVATASLMQRFSQVTEAFAGLRAMLDSPQYKEAASVVLIASSVPGEGKTVTSCNLASAWARKGRKVLLLDFDLRRPQLAGIFPMPTGQKGLLQALSDDPDLKSGEHLVYPVSDCPNLHIIATRPFSGASPAEVAGTPAVERLIAWARLQYDHVVIDAPPLGLVSDALALAPLADSTLVMVRPSVSRKRITLHTIHRFQDSGIESVALVVNDVNFKKFGHHSYGYYYQGYGQEESTNGKARKSSRKAQTK